LKNHPRSFFESVFAILLLLGGAATAVRAQNSPNSTINPTTQTILVLPFENTSKAPGIEWIGEAFPEVLGQRLSSPGLYVISREDRNYAFDRMGIPVNVRPSRATLYRIAEQMDADYVVLGDYNFDGQTFTGRAQVLDMKRLRLSNQMESAGPLVNLISIETGLAYELLKNMNPQTKVSKVEFMNAAQPVRLDAFENYIRGLVTTDRAEKIKRLKEAVRLNPQYTLAMLQLGRTYYKERDYEGATTWLAKVPPSDESAGEANFILGLSYYYLGLLEKAETAFKVTESKIPLTEVVNDVGVVLSRRNKAGATDHFQHAAQADPADSDYAFNYALSLWRDGDTAAAIKELRDSVQRHPTDVEAKQLLDTIIAGASAGLSRGQAQSAATLNSKGFVPRIKKNYDETSYRQLALELQNVLEQSASKGDPKRHAALLVEQGQQLLATGMTSDAEHDFREAVVQDPTNAEAHLGLAKIAETKNDDATARAEANAALQLQQSSGAYLVLARSEAKANNLTVAIQRVDQALWLEPNNAEALTLKHDLKARQTPQ
jgi:Flp pilus assembly protein TadD/TolB-like protein